MNYRHAYHAGNFADVLKHAVLARAIEYLKRKPAPFRIVDTHAGSARYALDSGEAAKTGEWTAGIGRLLGPGAAPLPPPVAALMAPYLDTVRAENTAHAGPGAELRAYPGSPRIAQRLMRVDDALIVNEPHPEEHARLKAVLTPDRRVKVLQLDGWLALKAQLPPSERRGIVLVDPPFEQPNELARMAEGLGEALRRFASGVYLAWYPIKDPQPVARFHHTLAAVAGHKALCVELLQRRPADPDRLNGCGLVVINPPHTLQDELAVILPELVRRFADGGGARFSLGPLVASEGGNAHRPATPRQRKRSTS